MQNAVRSIMRLENTYGKSEMPSYEPQAALGARTISIYLHRLILMGNPLVAKLRDLCHHLEFLFKQFLRQLRHLNLHISTNFSAVICMLGKAMEIPANRVIL